MKKVEERIEEITREVAESRGLVLLEVEYFPRKIGSLIRLYLYRKERQVSLMDCEQVSREVELILDEENFMPGSYTLEVSSPGLFRKIKHQQEYALFLNQRIRVLYRDERNNTLDVTGVIFRTGENSLTLDLGEKGLLSVDFKAILQANLAPEL
ncbi:MAG: Ribosome maturation factor RimP [candidate division WS2 bacterium]|nr:Ribosome maturation factor RimP [Candidatus Lithacetigena glycinireducens]MBT9174349.1 Ribosome maturation factor RimP [Candidatus Lithacetigena glycinireducens]